MANKKSKSKPPRARAAARDESPGAESVVTQPGGGGRRRAFAVAGAVFVIAVGGFVVWRRSQDPARVWAQSLERAHATKIDERTAHCFGGSDGAAIRRIIPEIRRGNWPMPFRECAGSGLSNIIASPLDFALDMNNPPDGARSAKLRERDKLDRVRGSVTNLQRLTTELDRSATIPEGERDRIVTALEDVAVDIDAEHSAFGDLVNAARTSASLF